MSTTATTQDTAAAVIEGYKEDFVGTLSECLARLPEARCDDATADRWYEIAAYLELLAVRAWGIADKTKRKEAMDNGSNND